MNKKILFRKNSLIFLILLLSALANKVFTQVPVPDAWYTFDETSGTQITDSSGNGYHAFWYNYEGEDPGTAERTGWRPDQGYRGGAGYFAGDHSDCVNACSSGSDLLIFSKSLNTGSDVCMTGDMPENPIFKSGFTDLTLAFWFRNGWNYLCDPGDPVHACYSDPGDCAWERQVLWTAGDGGKGLTMEITPGALYPALVKVTINGGVEGGAKFINAFYEPVQNKEWVHFAVVFNGDSIAGTGEMKLYLDGILQNTVSTDFGYVPEDETAVVFGGENGASVSGKNVTDCWGEVYELCGITAEEVGRVRFGWPARGWIDELAYWKNKVLTEEEIIEFARIGETPGTTVPPVHSLEFDLYPSVTSGRLTFRNINPSAINSVSFYNTVGQQVFSVHRVIEGQIIQLPSDLSGGVYIVCLTENNARVAVRKIILK
jgi:hypothetical protein